MTTPIDAVHAAVEQALRQAEAEGLVEWTPVIVPGTGRMVLDGPTDEQRSRREIDARFEADVDPNHGFRVKPEHREAVQKRLLAAVSKALQDAG